MKSALLLRHYQRCGFRRLLCTAPETAPSSDSHALDVDDPSIASGANDQSTHDSPVAPGGFKRRQQRLQKTAQVKFPVDFRFQFPDFLPNPDFGRRHHLREKLERMDMLRRRENLEIPEFYVGSILAVKVSDPYAPERTNRFVGICILRSEHGLRHTFILRNVIEGHGFEIRYDMYNPLIREIQVLKLEKWLDEELLYLRDAPPEYSTIPFNMEPIPHPPDSPVPVQTKPVPLRPPQFWHQRWYSKIHLKGIQRPLEPMLEGFYLKKLKKGLDEPWRRMDIMQDYRDTILADEQANIYKELEAADRRYMESKSHPRRRYLIPKPRANNPDSFHEATVSAEDTDDR